MEGCLNRSRAWLRLCALSGACLFLTATASPASASVTVGQLAPFTPTESCTVSGIDYLQPSVTGGQLYNVREAGTITSWSTNSASAGATYTFKIFRRTSDPDFFQVIAHAQPHILGAGVNAVPVSIHVESGDMIGVHESGPDNSCTFDQFGDTVLNRTGNLGDGVSGAFTPLDNVRLNLSAVLAPDNAFTFTSITRDRKNGTATVTVTTSNPGLVAIAGKGMKKRSAKTLAVAGPVTFPVATVGKTRRKLERKHRLVLPVRVTFFPTGGDPTTQSVNLTLRRTRPPTTT